MGRRVSREERPLVIGGVIAGLLTSFLVLYLYATGTRRNPEVEFVTDTMRVLESEDLVGDPPPPAGRERAPVIGARERSIRKRLAGFPVSTKPLSGPVSITARNVIWNESNGASFARADVVSAQLDMAAAEQGDIALSAVVLRRPVVNLREDAAGWNYEQVLDELINGGDSPNGDPDPRPGRTRTFRLEDVRIENGTVDVTRPGERFAFQTLDARLPAVVFSEPGLTAPYVQAAELATDFVQDGSETRLALGAENGLFVFPDGTVEFDVETAALDDALFADLNGVWDPDDPGYGVTASGVVVRMDFADLAFALPDSFPATGTASFAFAVTPVQPDLTELALTDLDAVSGDSRLLGDVTMVLGADDFELVSADLRADPISIELIEQMTGNDIPYDGTLVGDITGAGRDIAFELTARLTAPSLEEPFSADLDGQVSFTDDGVALQRLALDLNRVPLAALRIVAPGLPLEGTVTGQVTLTGPPDVAPLDLNVRLELGAGVAIVEGTLDLTGVEPAYALSGRLLGVDVDAILEPEVPPVILTASFDLTGAGVDPATMNADLRLDGRFTGWETTPRDTVTLAATIRNGSLDVDTLYGSLATADVEASGTWRFVAPETGAITYALDVTSLDPFGPWIPVLGDSIAAGSLLTTGTLSGTIDRIRVAGGASGSALSVGEWQAQTFTGTYDIAFGDGRLPVAIVNLEAGNITTPTAGNYSTATIALELLPPGLALELNAERAEGGVVEVVATGNLPEFGERQVLVERAQFDLENDRWVLLQPATFRWVAGGPVTVEGLELEAERSEGRVAIDGVVLPLEEMNARVDIAALPVGDIQRLLSEPVRLDGLLYAEGTIGGGELDSTVDLEFRVEDGALAEVPIDEFTGTLTYAAGETRLDAEVVVDTAGSLDIVAELPSTLRIGGTPMFELVDGVPLSGSITAEQFALAPLFVTIPNVTEVTGYVDAEITLAGTADSPEVEGSFVLANGSFRVPSLNQTFTEASGNIGFDGRNLVVEDVRVRSEGWMIVSGEIVLERLTEPVLDLTIALEAFEPMGVDDHPDAGVWGEVALTGPPGALVLTGEIEVADGYVVLPEMGAPAFGDELVDMTRPPPTDSLVFDPDPDTDIVGNLEIRDLTVDVGTDTWFDAYRAQVQLTGELVVNKTGNDVRIVGTLSGDRGQYTLIAGPVIRRFEIVSAELEFRGESELNPAIDITARRIVLDESGNQIDVDVRITGTADEPTLQLAGGGQIDESQLLSFLLFGTPSSTLGQQVPGDVLLEQTYVGAFWEVVALELERSLGQLGLGLDIFQVRIGQGTFGFESPTIVAGKQLAPDVFLTLETALGGLFDGGESDATTWSIRLDWAFDRRTQLRLALEPVYRGRGLRSSTFALPLADPRQQLLIELRRRWSR